MFKKSEIIIGSMNKLLFQNVESHVRRLVRLITFTLLCLHTFVLSDLLFFTFIRLWWTLFFSALRDYHGARSLRSLRWHYRCCDAWIYARSPLVWALFEQGATPVEVHEHRVEDFSSVIRSVMVVAKATIEIICACNLIKLHALGSTHCQIKEGSLGRLSLAL